MLRRSALPPTLRIAYPATLEYKRKRFGMIFNKQPVANILTAP